MTDENPGQTSGQQPIPQQPEGQQTVEIDPRRRVGIAGGVHSFHRRVDGREEQ